MRQRRVSSIVVSERIAALGTVSAAEQREPTLGTNGVTRTRFSVAGDALDRGLHRVWLLLLRVEQVVEIDAVASQGSPPVSGSSRRRYYSPAYAAGCEHQVRLSRGAAESSERPEDCP
jgi:hypothetical protein